MEFQMTGLAGGHVEWRRRAGSPALVLAVRSRRARARCPDCGRRSVAVHSTYVRRPADLPQWGRAVMLEVPVRRFVCRVATCPRRTFAEPWTFVARHAQR